MNDDELLGRMKAADPARTTSPDDSWIPDLVEAIMSTPAPKSTPTPAARRRPSWLAPVAAAAAVAAVAALGAGAYVALDYPGSTSVAQPTVLALEVPASDAMSMCMAFDPTTLGQAQVAFSGTVDSVDDEGARLTVDHWYAGGDADVVELEHSGAAANVALDGVAFTRGERYLVSASDGQVATCGYSGTWTQDFAAQFEQAFGR